MHSKIELSWRAASEARSISGEGKCFCQVMKEGSNRRERLDTGVVFISEACKKYGLVYSIAQGSNEKQGLGR